MSNPSYVVREEKEVSHQIKSDWLGAEAHVHLPPRSLAGNRFMFGSWRVSLRILLISFSSGLAMGGGLAWFARGQFGRLRRLVGHGERGGAFRVPREVTPCLD